MNSKKLKPKPKEIDPKEIDPSVIKKIRKLSPIIRGEIFEILESAGETSDNSFNLEEFNNYKEGFNCGSHSHDRELYFLISAKERKYFDKLVKRLREIETADFSGLCELCKKEIPWERLITVPIATKCCDCKNGSI